MDARETVLAAARTGLRADTAEEGFAGIRRRTGTAFTDAELADAVAALVAEGLLRDPVRLEQGALQCHWRAELAPPGVEAARAAHDPPSWPDLVRPSTSSLAASNDVDARDKPGHDGEGCGRNAVRPAQKS